MGPLAAAALAGLAVQGAQGVGQGITGAVQGAQMFNKEDERRLNKLKGLQATGQLGLSGAAKDRIESDQAATRGGMLRTQQSQQAAANQALANQQALSGREIFLSSLAGQEAESQLRGEQAQAMAAQDMQARQQQLSEINMLKEQERARKMAVRGGIAQALTAGVFGAGGGMAQEKYAQAQAEHAMKTMELNAKRIQDMGLNESDAKMVSSLSRALPPTNVPYKYPTNVPYK